MNEKYSKYGEIKLFCLVMLWVDSVWVESSAVFSPQSNIPRKSDFQPNLIENEKEIETEYSVDH